MTKVNNSGNTKDDLLENCTSFINSYDGSADAFANSERFMKDLFHPDFTFLTKEGPKDLRWYHDFAASFASRPGSAARVTHIEWTGASSILVTIVNVVAWVKLDPITYNGMLTTDEDGKYKIRHFEPVKGGTRGGTSNMENVEKMVQLATNLPFNMKSRRDDDYGPCGAREISDGRRLLVTPAPPSDIS